MKGGVTKKTVRAARAQELKNEVGVVARARVCACVRACVRVRWAPADARTCTSPQLLNSKRLAAHFEDNPQDLQVRAATRARPPLRARVAARAHKERQVLHVLGQDKLLRDLGGEKCVEQG